MKLPLPILALTFFTSLACAPHASDEVWRKDPGLAELYLIPHTDPKQAAILAHQRHDDRFLGIVGYGLDLPGLTAEVQERVYANREYRAIVGTRDFDVDDNLAKLISTALRYAAIYNQTMLHLTEPPTSPSTTLPSQP